MQTVYVSTILNIDSSLRNIYPKHICTNKYNVLPPNPFYMMQNIINITYPNHNFNINDNIIIENVEGYSKIISNEFYLINNFKYLMIHLIDDNMIDINYNNYTKSLYINIDIYGTMIESIFFNNIPFNTFIGIKKSIIANDIPTIYFNNVINIICSILNISHHNALDYINKYCIFIELPYEYLNYNLLYYSINQTFIIKYLHINGVELGYLNANFPIGYFNYQSSYSVYNIIDNNTFSIQIKVSSYPNNIHCGGNNIRISKIVNSIDGYPDIDNYIINLNKTFTNVIDIQLISSEFPYTDMIIKKNINDKLYWKNIEDGNHEYVIQIPEGIYTTAELLKTLTTLMNNIERITSSNITKIYNNFEITLEANTHTIIFKTYININLPNSISVRLININNNEYYLLNIHYSNITSIINVNDEITIYGSENVTFKFITNNNIQNFSIDKAYINKTHILYAINKETQSYDIILGKKDEITNLLVNYESAGSENINIRIASKCSLLFNKSDTIGEILGFKNVGETFAYTEFKSIITNTDLYNENINITAVGNEIINSHNLFNFIGKYNYFLMYLNNISYIYTNNSLEAAFAKILLSASPNDIVFNTFVTKSNNGIKYYDNNFPIAYLDQLKIKFMYPDGTRVNFYNINHSYTLQIIEEKYINSQFTNLNSKKI